jgi:hypothetical protein
MSARNLQEYAALWREQIGPEELAELQTMATRISRTAGWKWAFDLALALVAAGMTGMALLLSWGSPLITLGLLFLLATVIWYVGKRRQITSASQALAVDRPQFFFQAAQENARAEIKLSNLSILSGLALLIAAGVKALASVGPDRFPALVLGFFVETPAKLVVAVAAVLVFACLIRDNICLRERLRRLEAMHRDWEERDPREPS